MEPSQRFDGGDIRTLEVAPSTAGTYYYGACLDPVDGESDTTNNCSSAESVTVVPASGSDLVIESFEIPEVYFPTLPMYARVRNQGTGLAATTPVSFYRSTDATISTSDTRIDGQYVRRLAPSETGTAQVTTIAETIPGTYYYGACVGSVSGETDTTNNCSAAVAVTVGGTPTNVPGVPTGLSAAADGQTEIDLSWTAPSDDGGATITGYRIEVSTDGSSWSDLVADTGSTATTYSHTGLTAGSTRHYRVSAINSAGTGTASNVANAATGSPRATTAPGAPTGLSAAANGQTQIDLSWTAPSDDGGVSITGYKIEVSTDGSSWSDLVADTGSTATTYSHTGLTAASTRHYRVSAINSAGTGAASNVANAATGDAPAPDLVVDTPTVSESAPAAGASFTLSATVRNQGAARSASTTLRYYQSADATITIGDTEVGADSVFQLSASASGDESISLTAPAEQGTYYYGGCVDEVSDESDTTNNCSDAVTVTVGSAPAPDLVVDTPRLSGSSPAAGASFGLFATVRNQGSGPSDSTTLRYYRSTDSTITTGDTQVGTESVSRYDASEGGEEWISLDAPSTPGTYYYGACVDAVSGESDTTNNCSAALIVTVGATHAPDLVVDTPTVSESSPPAGGSFTLGLTVRNQGSAPAGSTTVRYYQSSDPTIVTYDFEVGTDSVSGLSSAGSSDQSISLPAPSTPGTYYFGACVGIVTGESDTTNNCSASVKVTISASDLIVDTPTVSDTTVRRRFVFTLSATARNQGSGPSNAANIHYYRSTDSTITTSDEEVKTTWTGSDSIPAGGSITRSVMVAAPFAAGMHYYGACVSPTQGEANTENNCSAAVAITVPMEPDVVVDSPTVSDSSPAAGQSFTLTVAVHNRGNASSAPTTIRYNRSTDPTLSTFQEVGTGSVGGLAVSESTTVSTSLTAPSSPGMYYYDACVDSVPGEVEAGLNNCSAAVTVTVTAAAGAPDLAVDTPTVGNSTLVIGSNFSLFATVRNRGSATSEATTLRYYRSTDLTITTSDTEVGTDSVGSLVSSSSSDQSIGLPAPSTTGTYYFGACVDAVSNESDTTNNCSGPVRVTVGAPDLVVETPTVSDSSPVVGASFTLSATVRNQGDGAAGVGQLEFYRSTDSTITDSDEYLGYALVHPIDLGPSGGSEESISLTAPSTPSTYYYGACVQEVLHESDTTNNCSASVSVIVRGAPDLVVDTPTVSESAPYAGGSFTLSVTVRNQGNGSAGSTSLRYYRSVDPAIFRGYTEIGTDSVSGLDSSGSSDESNSLTAPSTPGTYYYYACVDEVSGESDTTNNCSASVTVTVKEAIQLRIKECFVFQNQHFARFEVTARIAVSSLVVKTYAVDSRNNERHLMETTNVGSLSAGSSHEELTSRFFPAFLARYLTSCDVSATWQ